MRIFQEKPGDYVGTQRMTYKRNFLMSIILNNFLQSFNIVWVNEMILN